MEYAYIECEYKPGENGQVIKTYQWVGWNRLTTVSPIEAVRETGSFQPEFSIGNLLLRVVDYDGHRLIATRDSKWLVPIYRAIHRMTRTLEIIWHCFIYILHIWHLADHHPAEIPTWRNVKAAKWIAEKWGL